VASQARSRLILPETVVVRRGLGLQLRLQASAQAAIRWEISAQQKIAAGKEGDRAVIALPADLAIGSYRLAVTARISGKERSETAALLVAPRAAYQGGGDARRRLWALAVQLYGVRSRRNWGPGDFTDLAGLLDLAADLGAAGIGLNSLHVMFDDRVEEASPYSPSSRLFLNPLYIDLDAVPEFPGLGAAALEQEVAHLRQCELVDYAGVAAVKMEARRRAYQRFGQTRDRERARAF
jgi:4-alpha-glucanotransferase